MADPPGTPPSDYAAIFAQGIQDFIARNPSGPVGAPGSHAGLPTAQSDLSPLYIGYGPDPSEGAGPSGPIRNTVFGGSSWLLDKQANDPKTYNSTVALLRAANLLGSRATSQSSVDAAFEKALKLAAASTGGIGAGPGGGTTGTGPSEVLSFLSQYDPTGSTVPGAAGPSTSSTTDTSTSLSTALDARALLNGWMGSLLGSKAPPEVVDRFIGLLNGQQAANPTVTNRTATSSLTGSATSSQQQTLTTGGVSSDAANLLAQDFVESQPTYAGTQANTTLMGWLQEAILGTPTGTKV